MFEIWVVLQVLAVGGFFLFGSYLTYRQRTKRMKQLCGKPLIEVIEPVSIAKNYSNKD